MPNTQKAIDKICTYRGLPNLKKGMACEVDGENGVIFGGNHAANLNVKFNDGRIRNCHPGWRMKVFDRNGDIFYKSYRDETAIWAAAWKAAKAHNAKLTGRDNDDK